jgi:MoxR-like ATPase
MTTIAEATSRLIENIERVIVGKRHAVRMALVALLADGHLLIEDVPGVAKTMLARAMALSIGGVFRRLQCTPDLLPSDITGVSLFNQKTGEFEFRPGPVMSNILLADEINRATPRTQSALLESMGERQVSVDGETRPVPHPFLVLATQNPIEYEGTFPLPEAQLDRFLMRTTIGYPSAADESEMLLRLQRRHPIETVTPVLSPDALVELQGQVRDIFVHARVREYIVAIAQATRSHPQLALGASPRGSLALLRCAQALAGMEGLDFVLPDHVKIVARYVLGHRIILRPESRLRGVAPEKVLEEIVQAVPAPVGPVGKTEAGSTPPASPLR